MGFKKRSPTLRLGIRKIGSLDPGAIVAVGADRRRALVVGADASRRIEIVWLEGLVPVERGHLWSDHNVFLLPETAPLSLWDVDAPRRNAEQERAISAMIARSQ